MKKEILQNYIGKLVVIVALLCTFIMPTRVFADENTDPYIQIVNDIENNKESWENDIQYGLIYVTNDDVPELAVWKDSYWVSLYTIKDGNAYCILDKEGIGTWGRYYYYKEKQGLIKETCYEFTDIGSNCYDYVLSLGENYILEPIFNGKAVYGESDIPKSFYNGETEVSKQEYESYTEGFEMIEGTLTASEILKDLEGEEKSKEKENKEKETSEKESLEKETSEKATDETVLILSSANERLIVGDIAKVEIPNIDISQLYPKGKAGTYSNGYITAVKKGKVKLYINNGSKKTLISTIRVEKPRLKESIVVKTGKSKRIKLKGTKRTVDSWSSSNSSIAEIDTLGNIKGITEGTATVTAKIGNHEYQCQVTVK